MNYLFRVDFSEKLGFGHLMRCLAIQENIKKNKCIFVIGNNKEKKYNKYFKESSTIFISKHSYSFNNSKSFFNITKDIEFTQKIASKYNDLIIIVDNYKINKVWTMEISKYCKKLILVNDILKKNIYCDIILDQTFNRSNLEYENLLLKNSERFIGHEYAIIRKQFYNNNSKNINKKYIFVSMGGSDHKEVTMRIIKVLINQNIIKKYKIIIVLNKGNLQYQKIKKNYNQFINLKKIFLLSDVYKISNLMKKSFLAIGSGGVSAIERCKMGLPSLVFQAASNQKEIIRNMEEKNLIISWKTNFDLENKILDLLSNTKKIDKMRKDCLKFKIGNKTKLFYKKIL